MKWIASCLALVATVAMALAQSDPLIESAQQALKDQGFYYGELTGRIDADTTAAIRRYQIRNGLQVTGDLNAETKKSLGIKGNAAAVTPPPEQTPQNVPSPDTADLRDDQPARAHQPSASRSPDYSSEPPDAAPLREGIFQGTPYQFAPPDQQARVIVGAQTILARRGLYRDQIDGLFGPAMEFSLRAYQAEFGLASTGRLDRQTLGALGLLPGQRGPGVTAPPRRRVPLRPTMIAPNGEPIYTPN